MRIARGFSQPGRSDDIGDTHSRSRSVFFFLRAIPRPNAMLAESSVISPVPFPRSEIAGYFESQEMTG